jgi:hypothetical protein
VPQAEVQAEAAQQAQAGSEPVNLEVTLKRPLAGAAGRPELGLQAAGQLADILLEGLRDGREMLLVGRDQRGVGLGGKAGGKVKRAGAQRIQVDQLRSGSRLGLRLCGMTRVLRQAP